MATKTCPADPVSPPESSMSSLNLISSEKIFAPAIVCAPVVLTTVESTLRETPPDVPPPVRPFPAVTDVISP